MHTLTHTHTTEINTHKALKVLMANKYKVFIPDLSHPLQWSPDKEDSWVLFCWFMPAEMIGLYASLNCISWV